MNTETQTKKVRGFPTRLIINRTLADYLLWEGIPERSRNKVAARTNGNPDRKEAYQTLFDVSDTFPERGEVGFLDYCAVQVEWDDVGSFGAIKSLLKFIDKDLYKVSTQADQDIQLVEGNCEGIRHE